MQLAAACLLVAAAAGVGRGDGIPASFHASRVVDFSPGAGYSLFPDPLLALGGPYGIPGGSLHVVSLGVQGELVLGFEPGQALHDESGPDLIVFENPFGSAASVFAELVRVGVSTNGADYAFFATSSLVPAPMGSYDHMDPSLVSGFAGVEPVLANVGGNTIDPFSLAAGGDVFDLADLAGHSLVVGGEVDLARVYYLKFVDVLGDGSEYDDSAQQNPIYDPTGIMDPPYSQPTSADIDAISVIHGLASPAPGDANRDEVVDVVDLAALANNFGVSGVATWEQADFNGDRDVDVLDLAILANHFGQGGGGGLVPEPLSVALWLAATAVLTGRRRSRGRQGRPQMGPSAASTLTARAFTLIELLIVVSVLALLVGMLAPSLYRARELARIAVCKTNLGGLIKANQFYAEDNACHYAPAASDIFRGYAGNLNRWHGVRVSVGEPFDPAKGPLVRYLGSGGQIKQCPSFTHFRDLTGVVAYEAGSGGYGYSDLYVGSEFWRHGFYHDSPGQLTGARTEDVRSPGATVMFTDAAMPQKTGGRAGYVEESFCYCPFNLPLPGQTGPGSPRQPSIHFRHLGTANVGWVDGHVSDRDDFRSVGSNCYGANPAEMMVGWFGPEDNSLFDLE